MNIFRKNYWKRLAALGGKTRHMYLLQAQKRYVLLIFGSIPDTWEDGTPRLFDSFRAAVEHCLTGDKVVSEHTFIRLYCN